MLLENFRTACIGTTVQSKGMDGNFSNYSQLAITDTPAGAGYYTIAAKGWYVNIGYGDTAVDKGDYKLANDNIIDTNSLTYVTGSVVNTTPSLRCAITTYRNDTASAVVVKELGLVGKCYSAANELRRNVLIARKVLETPITVPAGATMSFTYSIDLNFTENVSAS